MSFSTSVLRSNVAIFGLPAGLELMMAVPIALLSAITALMPGCDCRYEVTCPTACWGLDAAFGVDSVSSVQAGPFDGAEPVLHVWPTPRPWAMPLHRSSRFCPDWWITHRTLVAPSALNFSPEACPASVSGCPTQVIAPLAAMSWSSQPALRRTTGMPAAAACLSVAFIRLGSWSDTAMPLTLALIALVIYAFSALSSGCA